MTRRSILEYAKAVRPRYLKAAKHTKTRILNEFIATTGQHRKAGIRLLNRPDNTLRKKSRGRPRCYDNEAETVLLRAWEATDHLCSKRLQPFLPELVRVLARKEEIKVSAQARVQLGRMSASTIDRILRRYPQVTGQRKFSTTKPGALLKNAIPIRTFSQWDEKQPGFLEADLVGLKSHEE